MKSGRHNRSSTETRHFGLTVVEMLLIITAVAVVFVLAIPFTFNALKSHSVENSATEIAKSLNLAFDEANRRHSTVWVCPSSDGNNCRSDGNWNHGWLVFSDGNGNGSPQSIERISVFGPPGENVSIHAYGAVSDAARLSIAGLSAANDATTGEFHVCHLNSDTSTRIIHVDEEGWVRMEVGDGTLCRGG